MRTGRFPGLSNFQMSDNVNSTARALISAQTEPAETAFTVSDQMPEVAVGFGGIVSLFGGCASEVTQSNLFCENGGSLVQEDGDLILLE